MIEATIPAPQIVKLAEVAWVSAARAYVAKVLIGGARALDAGQLEQEFRERVSRATTATVMAVMDQQGITHCGRCPARAGLEKRGAELVCQKHQDARDGG